MGTATSNKVSPAVRPEGEQKDWPVFVCHQGAFLFDPRAYFPVDPEEAKAEFSAGVELNLRRGRVALPPCRKRDMLLDQPPLGLKLSQAEAETLIADTVGAANALAATDVGPIGQDKASNQDFALAATIRASRRGRTTGYQFAAVADGVTTRTLWPERSARLAVFAAWRVARQHVDAGRDFSHQSFDQFRDSLIGEIRRCLETDRDILLNAGQIPNGWSKDAYRQFKERGELWYNSTLHVVLVGPEAGFALSCGDGGFVVRKHRNRETKSVVLVRSTDDLSVSGIVSLGPDSMRFRQTRITLGPDMSLDIIVATDGVDRSLRREAGNDGEDFDPYGPDFLGSPMSALFKEPQGFKGTVDLRLAGIANREIDNVSAALLHWPPPDVLPMPPAPIYSRGIVAAGESVEDINTKMAAGSLPPPPPMPPPEARVVDVQPTTIVVARAIEPASKFTPAPFSATHGPARRFASPPSAPRSNPASKSSPPPSSNRSKWNTGRLVPGAERYAIPTDWRLDSERQGLLDQALSRLKDVCQQLGRLNDQDYAIVFEHLLNCIPAVDIGGQYSDRKIGYPAFGKLLFFLMADIYSSRRFNKAAATDPAIERALDQYLFKQFGRAPSFSRKDMEFLWIFEAVDSVRLVLKRQPAEAPFVLLMGALMKL